MYCCGERERERAREVELICQDRGKEREGKGREGRAS